MYATSSFTLAFGLLANLATAQYAGWIYGVPGAECPDVAQDEENQELTWVAGTRFCTLLDIGSCAEGDCGIEAQASLVGTNAIMPGSVGSCSDDTCSDCVLGEIQENTDGFIAGCLHMEGRPYFYLE